MLAHRFRFYQGFRPRAGDPAPPVETVPLDYGTPDGYEFFLDLGGLANADEKYFKHAQPYWTLNVDHPNDDEVWQARGFWKYLKAIRPAVMLVGGWFDNQDLQGPLRQHEFMEKNAPPPVDMLVMGPWTHGGFARGDGDRVGNVNFGSKTGVYFREKIELPFFLYHLKGKGDGKFPKAWVFETGVNQWREFDVWPPRSAHAKTLFLDEKGKLAWQQPLKVAYDEYLSDPNKPVPYIGHIVMGMRPDYMTEDQRFASERPDVLTYKSELLDHDVTVLGPISVDLKVATTGTDSDFVVKLIDVYPGDYPDYNSPPAPPLPPGAARGAGEHDSHGRLSAVSAWRAVPRKIPQRLPATDSFRTRPARPYYFPHARYWAHIPHGASDHGPNSKLLVSVDGPQSAEVHGYTESAFDGFRKSFRACIFRRRGRIANSIGDCGVTLVRQAILPAAAFQAAFWDLDDSEKLGERALKKIK